jgi:ATP-binding protein involved in chromosome partitioning
VDELAQPATIDVKKDEGVTITFVDDHVVHFDLLTLRQACPCATCRGLRDQGEAAYPGPDSPQPLRIEDARLHGAWGLNITWNDGHATGIFPFESLRGWYDHSEPFGPDSGLGRT